MDLRNGNYVNFWYDNQLDESPLTQKSNPNMEKFTNKHPKVSAFITFMKQWDLSNLNNIFPEHIIDKIKHFYSSYQLPMLKIS